ncbi:MAG: alpha/beta hydrolase [Leptospira sp.]|nr:alpha/beta hydrolase [Leptospira sp.]
MIKQETGTIKTKFGTIVYSKLGVGKRIFLLHAAGHDRKDFLSIQVSFAKYGEVWTFDWPGHGESTWEYPEPISSVFFPQILTEILEKTRTEEVLLLGNSIGGYAAIQVALDQPSKVTGLILVDSAGISQLDLFSKFFIKLKSEAWFTYLFWNLFPKFYLKKRNGDTKRILEEIAKQRSNSNSIQTNALIWKSFLDPRLNLSARLSSLKIPVLLVWGKYDPVIPVSLGYQFQYSIHNSELQILPTGHLPFAEEPKLFLKTVETFFAKIH